MSYLYDSLWFVLPSSPADIHALLQDLSTVEGGVRDDAAAWIGRACSVPAGDLRRAVEKRLGEVAAGGPVRHFGMFVPARTATRFGRARDIASRKAGRRLTRPETLGALVDDYLGRHDPMESRVADAARRDPAKAGDSLPAWVRRAVRRRFGDRCAAASCTNSAFLEFAHVRARALGGSNDPGNLLLLCPRHHRMFDAKRLFLEGEPAGRRWFATRKGRLVACLRGPPPGEPPPTGPPG